MTSYEVVLDNAKLLANCLEEMECAPVVPDSGCFNFGQALFNYSTGDPEHPYGMLDSGGRLHSINGGISAYFPCHSLTHWDRSKTYRFTVHFASDSGVNENFGVFTYEFFTPESWGEDTEWIASEGTPDGNHLTIADVGADSVVYPNWGDTPLEYDGISFEFSHDSTIVESICWTVI